MVKTEKDAGIEVEVAGDMPCVVLPGEPGSLQDPIRTDEQKAKYLAPIRLVRFAKEEATSRLGKKYQRTVCMYYSNVSHKFYVGEFTFDSVARFWAMLEIDSTRRTFNVEKGPDNKLYWLRELTEK